MSAHSRKRRTSDKRLPQSFDVLREGSLRGRFLLAADAAYLQFLTHNSTVLPLWTLVPMNIEVPRKCPLSHNDRTVVLAIRLHSESPMLYRSALHGN